MENSDSKAVFWLLLIVLLSWTNEWKPFSRQITDYRVFCTSSANSGVCDGVESTAGRITFKFLKNESSIVSWNELSELSKFDNCVIRDMENWTCGPGDGSVSDYSMRDGRIVTHANSVIYSSSWWYWWLLHSREALKELKSRK